MSLSEKVYAAEFIAQELPGTISRDKATVTVAAATTLDAGLVLGRITASGKYVPYNNAAADGSETAAAILVAPLTNDGGAPADFAGVILNWSAEVKKGLLGWNGQLQAAIDAGLVDLATRGIKARDSV